tara:strand:- start:234 stop:536 length:303 start_codon:yes stop_codon:yes gene_type:complete
MNFKEVAKNYNSNKRQMITNVVVTNKNHTRNYPSYHAESLKTMFAEWHLLFPEQKQDMNCPSCRAAICKFWETIIDEWIEVEQTPVISKKKNAPKKTKTK